MPVDPFRRCACGHLWILHDVENALGDGTELCREDGCTQIGCPGGINIERQKNVAA